MSKKKYNNPNITISKVYTKKGDKGKTELIGKKNVYKNDVRVKAYGELDELNAIVGGCCQKLSEIQSKDIKLKALAETMIVVQNEIFNLGNMLATVDDAILENMPQVNQRTLKNLEESINFYNKKLPNLSSFVLPGGSEINIWLNLARVVCRRCERTIIELHKKEPVSDIILQYINRLSDAFFVWGRWANLNLNIDEKLWNPNKEID